jgi:hypothetical protein
MSQVDPETNPPPTTDRLADQLGAGALPTGLAVAGVGVLLAAHTLMHGPAAATGRVASGWHAAAYLIGFQALGWLTFQGVRVTAEKLRLAARRVAVSERVAACWDRVAIALETAPERDAVPTPPLEPFLEPSIRRASALAEVRRAVREERWDDAIQLAESFQAEYPGEPLQPLDEVWKARQAHVAQLQAQLRAAREAHDPERVVALREALVAHLTDGDRMSLDQDLVRWLTQMIQRRLLGGSIRPDVVELADRVATLFSDTKEGASLRASLPTLRRSAGLCPRCGQPYAGLENACPRCLNASAPPGPVVWQPPDEDEEFENLGPESTTES